MTSKPHQAGQRSAELLRRGFALEYVTLGWNVAGIAVLAVTAVAARSVALAGFGLDSLIEIGASTVRLARRAPGGHWTTRCCAPRAG
jgi:hypothetical protein